MSRRHFVVPVFSLALLALVGCEDHTQADPRNQVAVVRVAPVRASLDSSRRFTGIVAARVQSDLGFRVSGKVIERLVDTGQTVKRGQPLLRLDTNDLSLAVHAQQEAVNAAVARAKQATDEDARYRDLVAAGAVSASAYDSVKASADAAVAQLNAAKAQLDISKNASAYATLVADADGVVVETNAEPGQVVSAGQIVVRIAQAGRREALVQLPETLRPKLGSEAVASLYGQSDQKVPATLRQISDSADRATRTFEARYVLSGSLTNALLGATVTVEIPEREKQTQSEWLVPLASVYDPGTGPGLWTVTGNPTQVSWRPIKLLSLGDEFARVAGKLTAGERVVSLGAHLVKEGQTVTIAGTLAAPASKTAGAGQ